MTTTATRPQTAALICNTKSRQGQTLFEEAQRLLERAGLRLALQAPVKEPAQVTVEVEKAVGAGIPLVVVGGGDGTLACVSKSFVGSESVLGALPLGTGNSFARSLGIPLDLPGAIDVIVNGRIDRVDLGVVGAVHFVNEASIGLSAEVAEETPSLLKRLSGPLAYLLTGARKTVSHDPFICKLIMPERTVEAPTHQIIVMNGSVFGTTEMDPTASAQDGIFHVFIMRGADRSQIAKMWGAFLAGKPTEPIDAEIFKTAELRIETVPTQKIDVDGELLAQTPAEFKVLPRAIRMMLPRGVVA